MTDPSSFNPKLAALISRVQASVGGSVRGNGASGNSLGLSLDRVAVAEKNLEEARAAARVDAKREGVSLSNLFGDCSFIKRETGERWMSEAAAAAHWDGKMQAYEEVTRVFCNMRGVSYEAEMARAKIWSKICKENSERTQAKMHAAGFFAAVEANDIERAVRILNELFPSSTPSDRRSANTARQIIAAGARARSDGADERSSPEGLAKQIVNAGRRRRQEEEI